MNLNLNFHLKCSRLETLLMRTPSFFVCVWNNINYVLESLIYILLSSGCRHSINISSLLSLRVWIEMLLTTYLSMHKNILLKNSLNCFYWSYVSVLLIFNMFEWNHYSRSWGKEAGVTTLWPLLLLCQNEPRQAKYCYT